MVTLSEAKEQIAQARQNISTAKAQVSGIREQNKTIGEKLSSAERQIYSQKGLRSGKDINATVIRKNQIGQIAQSKGQLSERESAVGEYESNINQAEQQVNEYENRIKEYEEQAKYDREISLSDVEASIQMTLSPQLRDKVEAELEKANYKYSDKLVNRLNDVLNEKIKQPDIPVIEEVELFKSKGVTVPVYAETIPEKGKGLFGVSNYLSEQNLFYETKKLRGEPVTIGETLKNVGVNIAQVPVSAVISVSQIPNVALSLIKQPSQTTFLMKENIKEIPLELGEKISTNPSGTIGEVSGNIIMFGGISKAAKIIPKSLGYPKLKTTVASVPVKTEGDITTSNFLALTRQQNLLRNKNIVSVGQNLMRYSQVNENKFAVFSTSRGLSINKARFIKNPTIFSSGEFGSIQKTQMYVDRGLYNQELPDSFIVKTIGKSATRKYTKSLDAPVQRSNYISLGAGTQNEEYSIAVSRALPYVQKGNKFVYPKSGRGDTLSIARKNPYEPQTVIVQEGAFQQKVSRPPMDAIRQQQIKTAIESSLKQTPTSILTNTKGAGMTARVISEPPVKQTPVVYQSIYTGTGQYERTSETISPILNQPQTERQLNVSGEILKQDTSQKTKLKTNQDYVIGLREIPKQNNKFKINLALNSAQEQIQKQQQIQKQVQKQIQKTERTTARGVFGTFFKINSERKKSGRVNVFADKLFKIFKRTKGKDTLIGAESSLSGASSKLKNALKSDLSASGFIESEGQKVKAKDIIGFGGEFGISKKDYFRLVQKRGFRLGSYGERKEILKFKRQKKKRSKWF